MPPPPTRSVAYSLLSERWKTWIVSASWSAMLCTNQDPVVRTVVVCFVSFQNDRYHLIAAFWGNVIVGA
jgi:hypothetical protein